MIITENFETETMTSLYALLLNAKIMNFRCGIASQNDCSYRIALFLIVVSSTYTL